MLPYAAVDASAPPPTATVRSSTKAWSLLPFVRVAALNCAKRKGGGGGKGGCGEGQGGTEGCEGGNSARQPTGRRKKRRHSVRARAHGGGRHNRAAKTGSPYPSVSPITTHHGVRHQCPVDTEGAATPEGCTPGVCCGEDLSTPPPSDEPPSDAPPRPQQLPFADALGHDAGSHPPTPRLGNKPDRRRRCNASTYLEGTPVAGLHRRPRQVQ